MVIEALKQLNWTGKQLLVSCSGGVDSMTLLNGLLLLDLKPEVFHVNYGLRGSESDSDEELVRKVCGEWNLKLHLEKVDPELLKLPGINLQNEARNIRLDFFRKWLEIGNNRWVVLAHHADDQEETFFLRLLRGAGLVGLGAMHPLNNNICRPFLNLRKQDLVEWAQKNDVKWREDRSNATIVYARNRLRNIILPALHETNPNLNESVLLLTRCFRDEVISIEKNLESLIERWKNDREIGASIWQQLETDAKEVLLHALRIDTGQIDAFDTLASGERGKELRLGKRVFFRSGDVIKEPENIIVSYELITRSVHELPESYSHEVLYLDGDAICGKPELRSWMNGDFIEPIGIKGRQLVSKVLKDAGIAHQERHTIPVVSDEKNILWIPGIKISRHSLARKDTQNILEVKCLCLRKSSVHE